MTKKEADTILNIMLTADDGCSCCVANLFQRFLLAEPSFSDMAEKLFNEAFYTGEKYSMEFSEYE